MAYSNSKDENQRTLIYDCWERNIPSEVRADLETCIERSLNKRSRPKKLGRLAFDTSEDAVTWTVLRYLQQHQLTGNIFGRKAPSILYWGAEFPGQAKYTDVDPGQELKEILLSLKENPISLSEPDVVLIDKDSVCTIEVKYQSTNSVQRNHKRFENYTNAVPGLFKDAKAVAQSGYYELTRNLVFTKFLADKLKKQRWKVINLGMPRVLPSGKEFSKLLHDPNVFEVLTWPEVCGRIPKPRDSWFQGYLQRKNLEGLGQSSSQCERIGLD